MTITSLNTNWGLLPSYSDFVKKLIKGFENRDLPKIGVAPLYTEPLTHPDGTSYNRLAIGYGYDLNAHTVAQIKADI